MWEISPSKRKMFIFMLRGMSRGPASLYVNIQKRRHFLPKYPRLASLESTLVKSVTREAVPSDIHWRCARCLFTEGAVTLRVAILDKQPTVSLLSGNIHIAYTHLASHNSHSNILPLVLSIHEAPVRCLPHSLTRWLWEPPAVRTHGVVLITSVASSGLAP